MFLTIFGMPPKTISIDEQRERERIGATLRELRERDGWALGDFASQLDISYAYLSNIEAGRKPLTNRLLAKACKLLNCRPLAIRHPDADASSTTEPAA